VMQFDLLRNKNNNEQQLTAAEHRLTIITCDNDNGSEGRCHRVHAM